LKGVIMLKLDKILKLSLLAFILAFNFSCAYADDDSVTVANELNALYNKTDGCANGEPDYYCSGVIVHAQTFDTVEPWYLPTYRDVGSFSYIRNDIVSHIGEMIWTVNQNTGYILAPLQDVAQTNQYPYQVYCSYPMDGGTRERLGHSCGDEPAKLAMFSGADYGTCESKGVYSIDDFMKKYATQKKVSTPNGDYTLTSFDTDFCSFSSGADGFKLSMELYKYIYRDNPAIGCPATQLGDNGDDCWTLNELIISAWQKQQVDVTQIPIKAFYILINGGDAYWDTDPQASLQAVYKVAADYSSATHQTRNVPVVTIDMSKLRNGENNIFAPAPPIGN